MSGAYEPLRGRERALVIGLTAVVLLDVLAVLSSVGELSLLGRIERGEPVTNGEVDGNDTRQGVIGLVQFVFLVTLAVLFIRWLRRAFRNTDVLWPGVRRHGHGWATGAWFVPFLNLWRPK